MVDRFLDTNVLLYLLSPDLAKASKAEILLRDGGVISVQVLNEFIRTARSKMRVDWTMVDDYLAVFKKAFHVVEPGLATHEVGLEIAKRYGFQIFDCMLLASALEAGCETFLSEDMQHVQLVEGRLRIENPFL